MAVELRRQTEQKVLLADLDVNGGMVSFMMNCAPEHSILDAVSNIHRGRARSTGGILPGPPR